MKKQFNSTNDLLDFLVSERNLQEEYLEDTFDEFFRDCFARYDFETLANNKKTFGWMNADGEDVELDLIFDATMSNDDEFVYVITLF